MNIEKNHTEYTVKNLTVLTEKSTSTDGSQKSQQQFDAECLFSLRLNAEGHPIGLVVKQEDLPALIKVLEYHAVPSDND
jgi:hypothetical protein